MESQETKVLVIGDGVLVEGIVVSLERNPLIIVQRLMTDSGDILHFIKHFQPAVIVYPRGCIEIERLLPQIGIMPEVRLIGVEIDCNRVTITDSHVHYSLSLEAFLQLITRQDRDLIDPLLTSRLKIET